MVEPKCSAPTRMDAHRHACACARKGTDAHGRARAVRVAESELNTIDAKHEAELGKWWQSAVRATMPEQAVHSSG